MIQSLDILNLPVFEKLKNRQSICFFFIIKHLKVDKNTIIQKKEIFCDEITKNIKNVSTHLLTWLTTYVISIIEQKEREVTR
ncbi:hypothetical protein DWX22_00450 [Coprococcus sp. AF18-48]|nr:hypothetical protein DWX22_00450 [Coprococcus sp. AF18-48]